VASVEPGDEVTFEIRDSRDRTITRDSDHDDLLGVPSIAHPLTGPVEVRGVSPGDVLELEVLAYETDDFGWTAIWPGSGFLGDLFDRPFLARWELAGGVARSEQVPGVAVPACVHAGVIGVAPSADLFERAVEREGALVAGARASRGDGTPGQGLANAPSPDHAWPPEAADGLRTYPPRENGGNMDIRDLGPGARLWLPVHVQGALLSVGDLHFAQGDGEVCISAIETGGAATFRVGLRRGPAGGWRPRFPSYEAPPRPPRAMFATTGIPLADDGSQGDLDLNLATRRALLELLGWLEHERGLQREAAYVLMSVAAELRVSELVDAPNALVSAALPLDVFGTDIATP
jgi:formamidase